MSFLRAISPRSIAARDLGRTVTYCAKHDLAAWKGSSVCRAPSEAPAHERWRLRHADRFLRSRGEAISRGRHAIEILRGEQISFEYRHTSFAPDDMMLRVKLELPSKPYKEILQGIRICNEKRRSSQPLGQKSAGCIFKKSTRGIRGRMIDDLGLKA